MGDKETRVKHRMMWSASVDLNRRGIVHRFMGQVLLAITTLTLYFMTLLAIIYGWSPSELFQLETIILIIELVIGEIIVFLVILYKT